MSIPIQNGKIFNIAFFFELLYIEIKTPNNIHIDIWENILPKFEVYISNNLLIIPNNKPITNILMGFNIVFFNFIFSLSICYLINFLSEFAFNIVLEINFPL